MKIHPLKYLKKKKRMTHLSRMICRSSYEQFHWRIIALLGMFLMKGIKNVPLTCQWAQYKSPSFFFHWHREPRFLLQGWQNLRPGGSNSRLCLTATLLHLSHEELHQFEVKLELLLLVEGCKQIAKHAILWRFVFHNPPNLLHVNNLAPLPVWLKDSKQK